MQTTLQGGLKETPYALPSTRSIYPGFEPARYWRDPIWQHLTTLIAEGLDRSGHVDLGRRLHLSTAALFAKSGFCEYYHPLTGEGLGGGSFSRTAATYLFWSYLREHQLHLQDSHTA